MKCNPKWLKLISVLVPGMTVASCTLNMRDAALSGLMDAVTETVTTAVTTVLPVSNLIGQALTSTGL